MFTRQGLAEGYSLIIKPQSEIYMHVINKLIQKITKNISFYKENRITGDNLNLKE